MPQEIRTPWQLTKTVPFCLFLGVDMSLWLRQNGISKAWPPLYFACAPFLTIVAHDRVSSHV